MINLCKHETLYTMYSLCITTITDIQNHPFFTDLMTEIYITHELCPCLATLVGNLQKQVNVVYVLMFSYFWGIF